MIKRNNEIIKNSKTVVQSLRSSSLRTACIITIVCLLCLPSAEAVRSKPIQEPTALVPQSVVESEPERQPKPPQETFDREYLMSHIGSQDEAEIKKVSSQLVSLRIHLQMTREDILDEIDEMIKSIRNFENVRNNSKLTIHELKEFHSLNFGGESAIPFCVGDAISDIQFKKETFIPNLRDSLTKIRNYVDRILTAVSREITVLNRASAQQELTMVLAVLDDITDRSERNAACFAVISRIQDLTAQDKAKHQQETIAAAVVQTKTTSESAAEVPVAKKEIPAVEPIKEDCTVNGYNSEWILEAMESGLTYQQIAQEKKTTRH